MDGFDHDAVMKAFDIPDNYFIPMLICIGHFNEKYELMAPKWRNSYEEAVLKTY